MKWAAAAVMAILAANVQAQMKVSTGDPKAGSTYSKMFRELRERCPSVEMEEIFSTGSLQNMDRLVGNEVNAGIVQTDVIYLRGKTDDLGNLKTLFVLHPEEIHVVVRADLKRDATLGFGGRPVEKVEDLAGMKVAAAGGSVMTARVLQLLGEIPFTIVETDSSGDALALLGAKKVDAAILVGGAPLGNLSKLGADYRLLPIADRTAEKLKAVYVPAKVSYRGMNSTGVPTMATEAIFVTRDYKSKAMTDALVKLRACLAEKLDDLRDATGSHPKWQAVKVENRGKWTWYEAPGKR